MASETELTSGEQQALDLTVEVMQAVREIDGDKLTFNSDELGQAIHVVQSFVKQHYCHRLNPIGWSNWYGKEG